MNVELLDFLVICYHILLVPHCSSITENRGKLVLYYLRFFLFRVTYSDILKHISIFIYFYFIYIVIYLLIYLNT